MKRLLALALCLVAIGLTGCAEMVSVNRMISAPARPADCDLELVQADMKELSPMGTTWDMLGIVSVSAGRELDPASDKAKSMIRPKACGLGGTAVALMQSMSASNNMSFGSSNTIQFAVLRPKQAAQAPTKF